MDEDARFAGTARTPFWPETIPETDAAPPLTADILCDLAIIGGGFTGLWAALKARERSPDAKIALLEATRCGAAASGRNGGFCAPSAPATPPTVPHAMLFSAKADPG